MNHKGMVDYVVSRLEAHVWHAECVHAAMKRIVQDQHDRGVKTLNTPHMRVCVNTLREIRAGVSELVQMLGVLGATSQVTEKAIGLLAVVEMPTWANSQEESRDG